MNRRELYAAGMPFGECATAPKAGGGYVCGGGGGSSKSSSSTTTNTTVTDKRMVVDGGSIGISSEGGMSYAPVTNITTLDGGIVANALDSVNIANATLGDGYEALVESSSDGYKRLIDVTADMNTSSSNSFGQLLELAGKLFDSGASMIEKSQDATLAQIETINARAADQEGTIDQKTIIVLAVAGAAAVLSRGAK